MDNRGRRPSGYRSRTEIISRFRPVPTQEEVLPFVADHIAAESVRRQDGRWFWKFDPRVFALPEHSFSATDQEPLEEMFGAMRCRTGYILCERGIVPPRWRCASSRCCNFADHSSSWRWPAITRCSINH